MKKHLWIIILMLIVTACNLNVIQSTEAALTTPTSETPTSRAPTKTVVPIETLLARDTPTAIASSTSSVLLASPINQPVNCRFGPGISYAITGALVLGRQAEVIGKRSDETWWYVKNPSDPSTQCWLSADFVIVVGNIESLPVVSPPEIGVNNIQVQVDPVLMNVGCTAFPQTVAVTAQITVNGPTFVTWRWDVSNGDVSAEEMLLFESEGTKEVRGFVTVWSANDYWVNLHVLIPNDRSGGAVFKITCVP